MDIRRVQKQDAQRLRELHLRMYADSPNAFGESLADAQEMPTARWLGRARKLAEGEQAIGFLAMEADKAVGFIGAFVGQYRDGSIHSDACDTVTMTRAWVDPRRRRTGIGRAMTQAVESWALDKGAAMLEAQVTENNAPAIEFYRTLGFTETGRREPLLSNPALHIQFLSRSLKRTLGSD